MDQPSREYDSTSTDNDFDKESQDPISAVALKEPEMMVEVVDLPRYPPRREPTPRVRN
jgi:hypothetical protein